jgi:hypothetical protein
MLFDEYSKAFPKKAFRVYYEDMLESPVRPPCASGISQARVAASHGWTSGIPGAAALPSLLPAVPC